ncbi:hypothetical protein [Sulfurimonas sp.]|jgi:hypothetical protein|uniref:hypothetical protein n=1 Tax=Sulfurimonas sp. TaxID=2022749 RepID=UPI0025FB20C0|nr:hypothetical protein [Sulfurimonas sp.]MBT5934857.1 hypothetical protein [Sulfurimonas sp.]
MDEFVIALLDLKFYSDFSDVTLEVFLEKFQVVLFISLGIGYFFTTKLGDKFIDKYGDLF